MLACLVLSFSDWFLFHKVKCRAVHYTCMHTHTHTTVAPFVVHKEFEGLARDMVHTPDCTENRLTVGLAGRKIRIRLLALHHISLVVSLCRCRCRCWCVWLAGWLAGHIWIPKSNEDSSEMLLFTYSFGLFSTRVHLCLFIYTNKTLYTLLFGSVVIFLYIRRVCIPFDCVRIVWFVFSFHIISFFHLLLAKKKQQSHMR